MSEIQLPSNWIVSTLGKVLVRSNERIEPSQLPKRGTFYVGLENIESNTGLLSFNTGTNDIDLKSTKNVFHEGEILYGKLRPYLNKVYLAKENGICSTDIWVFHAKELIDPEYVFYYLRSPFLLQKVSLFTTGANLPRVDAKSFDKLPIPLPPLPEQRRIAAILREADEIRKLRQEANEKTQKIVEALFYDMFGDPVTNPKRWKTVTLGSVCTRITDGTHQSPQFETSGIPFLFISNIVEGKINLNTSKYISEETYYALSKRCPVEYEDILYSTVGSYGVPVIIDTYEPFAFQRHIALIKPDRQLVNPYFLKAMLNTDYVKKQAGQRVRGIAQGTLNLNEISKYAIYLPPRSLQEEFVVLSNAIWDAVEINQIQSGEIINSLHQSLLSQAFTGELTSSWREQHIEELTQVARERDALLERPTTISIEQGISTVTLLQEGEIQREDLIDQLSLLQRTLLDIFLRNRQSYFTAYQFYEDYEEELQEKKLQASLDRVRRELRTLAALGLIREITLPVTDQPGRVDYATVYRYPQPDDNTMSEDLELLSMRSL